MIHLNDRLFAVTLDSLRIVRDELRAKGLTGDECQQALDILQAGVKPTTDGILFEYVEPVPEDEPIEGFDFDAFVKGYVEAALWADCMPASATVVDARTIAGADIGTGGPWEVHAGGELLSCHATEEEANREAQCYHDHAETGGGEDLAARPGAVERMIERGQLHDFVTCHLNDLMAYVAVRGDGTASYAGHDFWLTRMGHGAGFWDRGLGELGDRLTEASKAYGSPDDHIPYDCGDGTFDV